MKTFLRNAISKLYNAVSAPVTAAPDALAESLQSVLNTAFLLYNRMTENMGYGWEGLRDIVEKEAEEEEQQQGLVAAKEGKEQQEGPAAAKVQQQQDDDVQYDAVAKKNWCTKENG